MEKDLVNIEDAGFTPEDLENAGVNVDEHTEETCHSQQTNKQRRNGGTFQKKSKR